MEKNQLAVVPPRALDIADKLAAALEAQQGGAEASAAMMNQMANAIVMLDRQVHAISSMLEKRVTVSSAQARSIAEALRQRVRDVCAQNGLAYETAGRPLRDAAWRALRATYQVPSHHDLPEKFYESALGFVGGWMPGYAMVRALRRG